ncbi:hypothetical protein CROQUDRAFT_42385 [Cronartium quercuum f. sp. fusiforme G11]|uniref:FAD-binding FR-type domain-containing protein n=1 Tax=Cronartium quercuum f. sp. fusiforme G11 TaxID=708437 RepID=A0A9P6NKL6_9BASI|nr:hypothetical protein CROQUDRAFT_42385 [Cronartium quercuum f. sp. fusiforme G11]
MKNTPFGILGKGYERVNFLHRFVGKLKVVPGLFVSGLIHGGLWLRMHLSMGQPIVFQGTPLAGLITICAFVVILLSSIKLFRSRFYQTFVILHVLGYVTVLVALWFHKESLRPFVGFAIGTVVLDMLQGMAIHTHVRSAVLTPVPGGMTKIQVENLGDGWRAGQHVYLRVMKGFRMFEKHPFTIANAPSSLSPTNHHQSLVLVAKATGDFTNVSIFPLHSLQSIGLATDVVKPNFHEEKDAHDEKDTSLSDCDGKIASVPVAIEGPYGRFYTDMCLHETAVLIAGGSGFTYCSATLEDIIGSYIKGDCVTTKVYVIWALRDLGMTHVFAPAINETIEIAQKAGLDVTFRIHISSSSNYTVPCPIDHAELIPRRVDVHELMRETLDCTVAGIRVRNASRGRGVGVGVCGPTALIASVRNAVASSDVILASKAGGISVHS